MKTGFICSINKQQVEKVRVKKKVPGSFLFVGEKQKKGGVPGQILKTMEEFPYT